MTDTRQSAEWMDLKALQQYACVSERTLREWIHRPVAPLPASRIGSKILVKRSQFDAWMQSHTVKLVDVDRVVNEILESVHGR